MITNYKVSILIPCYNRKAYIDQAIASVKIQDCNNIEVIVVDDGSTDGSFELLEIMAANGEIKLFCHPDRANKGQSAALNLAISKATGEYICILDSDDYLAEDKIVSQLQVLEKDVTVGMVYGKGQAVNEEGSPLFLTLPDNHQDDGDPNGILLNCFIAIPGGALIRKSVLDKVGRFDEGFRASQDHDMAIRIYEAAKVVYLPKIAFFYRKHGDSISQKGLERRWKIGFEIVRRAAMRWPYQSATLRKRKAVLHYRLGQVYLSQQRFFQCFVHYMCSASYDPLRSIKVILGQDKSL